MVADLKEKNPHQWYTAIKRLTSNENDQELKIEEINNMSDLEQCGLLADVFSEISNKYHPILISNISI